jgi:signal transduction histidine kinase
MFRQRPDLGFEFLGLHVEEFTGLSAAEWLNQPAQRFWELVHEADAGEVKRQLERAAQSAEIITSAFRIRHLVTGRVIRVHERRQAVRRENGSLLGFDVLWLDLTRETAAEKPGPGTAWLEISDKLTNVLIHDFNNLMTGIHAIGESFRSQIEPGHSFHEGLEFVQRNALRAKELVLRLANLNRNRTGTKKFFNLNELVTDELELLRKVAPRRMKMETTLAADSLPVYADEAELRRVIIGLTFHAQSEMSADGTLRIATCRNAGLPARSHVHGELPRQPNVCLAVTRTGDGIPAARLRETFDPLASAPPPDQTAETVLCDVARTVQSHGGAVSVESPAGGGATFRAWLPEADFTEDPVGAIP